MDSMDFDMVSGFLEDNVKMFQEGIIYSEEFAIFYLDRIGNINPMLGAVVATDREYSRACADAADTAQSEGKNLGSLHGVAFLLKDNAEIMHFPCASGTRGREGFFPKGDSTVARRLKEAGAVCLGKTATPEFGLGYHPYGFFGETKNPYDLTRSPGGSSGGAAAAISAGLAVFDIGSDAGGSIRVPASWSGIAGIKPTHGRVPRTGYIPEFGPVRLISESGPMARHAEDLYPILKVICGSDGIDPTVREGSPALRDPDDVRLKDLSVGVYTHNGVQNPDEAIAAAVQKAATWLQGSVKSVNEIVLPDFAVEQMMPLFFGAMGGDGGEGVCKLLKACGTQDADISLPLRSALEIMERHKLDSGELAKVPERLARFRTDMGRFMADYDALICPVSATPAKKLEDMRTLNEDKLASFSHSILYNLAGFPAATVRFGTSPEGLPIGVQVVAQPWREDVALAVARQLEENRAEGVGWKPPPF